MYINKPRGAINDFYNVATENVNIISKFVKKK